MKQVVLDFDGDENILLLVETEFSEDEIQEAASKIYDKLVTSENGWNEGKIIDELINKRYLKVIGEPPEIYNINAY